MALCEIGKRCRKHLSCRDCGESWQRKEFKRFCEGSKNLTRNEILTYLVIKPVQIIGLHRGIGIIYGVIEELREEVKRQRLTGAFFGRLEVSFSQQYGFNPHLNLLAYGNIVPFLEIFMRHDVKVWRRVKENNMQTAYSIVWYMLKYNPIGYDKGELVRKILNRRQTVINSRHFNGLDLPEEVTAGDIDFRFMGTCKIRYREEIEARREHAAKLRKERAALREKIEAIHAKYEAAS